MVFNTTLYINYNRIGILKVKKFILYTLGDITKYMDLSRKNNKRTEFTRICIAEAVIALLENQKLEQIRISNVVVKAGVSRMTFYNNYHSIEDVLKDYIYIIVEHYVLEQVRTEGSNTVYDRILSAMLFFDQYRRFFIVMRDSGLQGIILEAMNEYITNADIELEKKQEMYFYAGGLLNVFLEWETSVDRKQAQDVALLISKRMYKADL